MTYLSSQNTPNNLSILAGASCFLFLIYNIKGLVDHVIDARGTMSGSFDLQAHKYDFKFDFSNHPQNRDDGS